MRSSRTAKGKESDLSTEWTAFEWDSRGFYVSSRTGPNGDTEWDWKYPEPQTSQQQQETPRTPVTDTFSTSIPFDVSKELEDHEPSFQSTDQVSQFPDNSIYDRSPHYQHAVETDSSSPLTYSSSSAVTNDRIKDASCIDPVAAEQAGSAGILLSSDSVSPFTKRGSLAPSNLVESGSQNEPVSSHPAYLSMAGTSTSGRYGTSSLIPSFNQMAIGGTSTQGNYISTDSELLPPLPKHIYKEPNSEDFEALDPRYCVVEQRQQKRFWKEGRVFMMLWTEPARPPRVDRNGGTRNGSHFSTTTLFGEFVYSEIRRFVVLSPGYGNNICAPIQTYSKQATLKPNLPDPQQHAIIYTSSRVPEEKSYVAEDGRIVRENLTKDPIRVVSEQKDKEGELDSASRINYSKLYTVENCVRVLNIGVVHKNSMSSLLSNSIVNRKELPQPPTRHPPRGKSGNESRESSGKNKGSSHRSKGNDSNRRRK